MRARRSRRITGWTAHLTLVLCETIACACLVAPELGAQYPFVPPPLRCVPLSEGPGILAGIAPTSESRTLPRDLAVLQFKYAPLPADSDRALEGLRNRLEARLRATRPGAIREYAGPSVLESESPLARNVELAALGKQLGARRVLAGRIDQDAAGIHVALDIYDVRSGKRLWHTNRSGTSSELLAMEIALAREIAAFAFGGLTSDEGETLGSTMTRDGDAFVHYVRGIAYLRDSSTIAQAVAELATATRQAPKFAEAWSSLALAYASAATLVADPLARDSLSKMAIAAVDRSSTLAPRAAHSWIARGGVLASGDHPRPFDALVAYERAVMLEPESADAQRRLGRAMMLQGRSEAAQMHLLRAMTLDPEDPSPLVDLGELELNLHAFGQSCRALDLALSINPRIASAYLLRAMARLGRGGDVRHAWIDAETGRRLGLEIGGQAVAVLVDVAAHDTSGATVRARALQRRLSSKAPVNVSDGGYIALALAAIGDRAGALDLLERVRPRDAQLFLVLHRPAFDWLWSDIRFRRLLEDSNAGIGK